MCKMTRRASMGLMGAAMTAALAGKALGSPAPTPKLKGTGSMTLAEFQALNGPGSVAELFSHMRGDPEDPPKTFDMCHRRLRDEQGIWIPELVPIFREIDAKAAGSAPSQT